MGGLLFTGCLSTPPIGEISVSVENFQPIGASLAEARAIMNVRFVNENLVPVAFSGSTHKLYLNGTYVGKAVNIEPIGLAPLSISVRDVVISFDNLALIRQLTSGDRDTVVSYRLNSVMSYQQGDDKEELKAETNGSLDLAPLAAQLK